MSRLGNSNLFKNPPIFLVLSSILLITILQNHEVTCTSYISSDLKAQTILRYSNKSVLPLSSRQTRAHCVSEGNECGNTRDCCQFGGEFACGLFSSSSKTCETCRNENESCADEECCRGFTCDNVESKCKKNDAGSCYNDEEACYLAGCCENLRCIMDNDQKMYCSDKCSAFLGQCSTVGTTEGCCPGYYCAGSFAGPRCYCDNVDNDCNPAASPDTCCGNLVCDSGTAKCKKVCTDPGEICNADSLKCCSPTICDSTLGKCCAPANSACDINDPSSICCTGTICDGSKCVCADAPCTSSSDCCKGFECNEGKCKEKKECSSQLACTTDSDCCSNYFCHPVKLVCLGILCQGLGVLCP